ncbi:MAG: hypothetical protein KDK34_16635, partial [Leptospiraceae bacterium]|nr:hypothetical protein [Leptospiraceae bacterium]
MPSSEPAIKLEVRAVFDARPPAVRRRLLQVRTLIYQTARQLRVGKLAESLKWGQPTYTTIESGSGTPIRLGVSDEKSGDCALFVHCQTGLIPALRRKTAQMLSTGTEAAPISFQGNRAVIFSTKGKLPRDIL